MTSGIAWRAIEIGMLDGMWIAEIVAGGELVQRLFASSKAEAVKAAHQFLNGQEAVVLSGRASASALGPAPGAATPDGRLRLDAAIAAFAAHAQDRMRLGGRGKKHFVKVYRSGWPSSVHYEFLIRQRDAAFGVELHCETDEWPTILAAIRTLETRVRPLFPTADVVFQGEWQRTGCRLAVLLPLDAPAPTIAAAMHALIDGTAPLIDTAVSLRP